MHPSWPEQSFINVATKLKLTDRVYYDIEPIQRLNNLVKRHTGGEGEEIRLTDLTLEEMQQVLRVWIDKPAKVSSIKEELSSVTRAIVHCLSRAPASLIEQTFTKLKRNNAK